MNKKQQQIEDIRKEMINDIVKDDVFLFLKLSTISEKLWTLSHKLTFWQSLQVRIMRIFKR